MASSSSSSSSSLVSGGLSWEAANALDQITVVQIDDSHIAEEQSQAGSKVSGFYEMEYLLPAAEEEVEVGEGMEEEEEEEEEEEGVYVIEYSNPEEEGESYRLTMSVDRSLPQKKKRNRRSYGAPYVEPKPLKAPSQRRRWMKEEEEEVKEEVGEDLNPGKRLICSLCPPGRVFKRGAGLATHLKLIHKVFEKKKFFCPSCRQTLRTEMELDAHTRRHATQDAVFTCALCPGGFAGSRKALKSHLDQQHPGLIPRCHVCDRSFRSVASYLHDQFRHVAKTPYFCAECQIYEMTERGLSVHLKSHEEKKKTDKRKDQDQDQDQDQEETGGQHLQTPGVSALKDSDL